MHLLPGAGDPLGPESCQGAEEGAWKSFVEPETEGRPPAGKVKAVGESLGEMSVNSGSPQHTEAHAGLHRPHGTG